MPGRSKAGRLSLVEATSPEVLFFFLVSKGMFT